MRDPPPGVLFCFGLGYVAERVAERLMASGWEVRGTSRSPERRRLLMDRGIGMTPFDRTRPVPMDRLRGTTHVVTSIKPDGEGDPVLDLHAKDLESLTTLTWVAYLGSTAVYGDRQGGWVDETSPLEPTSPRGRRRVEAETAWRASGLPVHLFRLAGIYGPGRNALVRLRQGTALRSVRPGQVFSRIHVEDIVRVLLASMARPDPGAVYNVADHEPAAAADVVAYAASLMGVAPPSETPPGSPATAPIARDFSGDVRRISSRRIRQELGVELVYPTYREGLRALFGSAGG